VPKKPDAPAAGENLGRELSTAVVLFHEALASRLGMNAAEWRCLSLLHEHGPSTAGQLAELSGFTTGAITGIVDRLERAGYARRKPNPADGRSVIIHSLRSKALHARVSPVLSSIGQGMMEITTHYNVRELAAIADYLRRTIQLLRAQTIQLTQKAKPGKKRVR
jgi:DNA-binding MarR family transcriptional regulator